MNVDMRRIRTRLALTALLLALAWSAAGCGGSGSSGFDILPSEAQVIARAIDEGDCFAFEQQTICGSGAQLESGLFVGASVIIDAPDQPLVCDDQASPTEECAASLEFVTEGFRMPNSLLAAVAASEQGRWTLVPLDATEDVLTRTVEILVPGHPDGGGPEPFIAAVLVYAEVPPESVPESAETLAEFGTDLVYVSNRLTIIVPRTP